MNLNIQCRLLFRFITLFVWTIMFGMPAKAGSAITVERIYKDGTVVVGRSEVTKITYTTLDENLGSRAEWIEALRTPLIVQPVRTELLPRLPYFDFSPLLSDKKFGIFRLQFEIQTADARQICLVTDGRTHYRIAVNGVEKNTRTNYRWTEKYGDSIALELEPGTNLCEITVAGSYGWCSLAVSLASPSAALAALQTNWLPIALERYVYSPGERLHSTRRVNTQDLLAGAVITAPEDEGVYDLASIVEPSQMIPEKFVVINTSSVEARIHKLRKQFVQASINPTAAQDFEVFADRMLFLLKPSNRRSERCIGDRDMVEMMEELAAIEAAAGTTDWVAASGRHFAAFFSSDRNRFSPYMVYLPKGLRQGALLPLVVVFPSAAPSRSAFAESYPIDYSDLVHAYMQAADLNRFVVLWPYAENIDHTSQTERYVDEGIAAAIARLPIDPRKVTIIGACGAGRDALMFAARQSRRLMAVACHEVTFQSDNSSNNPQALRRTTPLYFLKQLARVPLRLSVSEYDRHVNPQDTLFLAEHVRAAGGVVELHVIPEADEGYYPGGNNQWIAEAFSFFHVQATLLDTLHR